MTADSTLNSDHPGRIDCVLIAAGAWHDIDYARHALLGKLGENERIRVRVFENYEDLAAIREADMLVTYTCNLMPSPAAQQVLAEWLEAGGRWLALHGTNCILEMMEDGRWHAPRSAPLMMDLLGSQFLSHPPIAPYRVDVVDPEHPLTHGIDPFDTTDELYHMELHGDLQVLLQTSCDAPAPHFAEGMDAPGTHPVMYLKNRGRGAVLYNTLGHCRGHYDMQPMMEWWPSVDRCAWDLPVFHELVRRGIAWAARADDGPSS